MRLKAGEDSALRTERGCVAVYQPQHGRRNLSHRHVRGTHLCFPLSASIGDHVSRRDRLLWGNHLVAGLGSHWDGVRCRVVRLHAVKLASAALPALVASRSACPADLSRRSFPAEAEAGRIPLPAGEPAAAYSPNPTTARKPKRASERGVPAPREIHRAPTPLLKAASFPNLGTD
jgi:hypothetical protein